MNDYKIIKKYYGEDMAQYCREELSTALETPGLLSETLLNNFYPTHYLFSDLKEQGKLTIFRDYIYSILNKEEKDEYEDTRSVKELFAEAGYNFYECLTEEDINRFKKYYEPNEELCTFRTNRLKSHYVFWTVRKDVEKIKREDYSNPKREDRYGTSVMSIQFSRGGINILSIKNRYNHMVYNPDATYGNNLDNIYPGLRNAFKREYGFNFQGLHSDYLSLDDYCLGNDGRLYHYNYEINNVYYCSNNIIIDNGKVKKYDPHNTIIVDYYIIDLKNKTVSLYDKTIIDSFATNKQYKKIEVINAESVRKVILTGEKREIEVLVLDKYNRLSEYINNNIKTIESNFMRNNLHLKKIELNNAEIIKNDVLTSNRDLEEIELPSVKEIGNNFICNNIFLKSFIAKKLIRIGNSSLSNCYAINHVEIPSAEEAGDFFLHNAQNLTRLSAPSLKVIGNNALDNAISLALLYIPKVETIGYNFLYNNRNLIDFITPNAIKIGCCLLQSNSKLKVFIAPLLKVLEDYSLCYNKELEMIDISSVVSIKDNCLSHNNGLIKLSLPSTTSIGNNVLKHNTSLHELSCPKVLEIGKAFLFCSEIETIILPLAEKIDDDFMALNENTRYAEFPNIKSIGVNFFNSNRKMKKLILPDGVKVGDDFFTYYKKFRDYVKRVSVRNESNKSYIYK